MAETQITTPLFNAIDRARIACSAFDQSGDISDRAKSKLERQWQQAERLALAAKPVNVAEAFAKLHWIMDEVGSIGASQELRGAVDDLEQQTLKA